MMQLRNHCQQALINLNAAKMRSFLAVLGILVGTAAVVALLSCGQLATEKALSQFKALGTELLSINLFQQEQSQSKGEGLALTIAQWRQMPVHIPNILQIAPYSAAYAAMSFQGQVQHGVIIGADETLADIIHISLAAGNFVSFVDTYEHYCVIGAQMAEELQKKSGLKPLGKQMRIGNSLYTIIGVANFWQESGFFNEDINQAVIIPIAGMTLIAKDNKINNAVLKLRPDSAIDPLIAQVKKYIKIRAPKLTVYARSAKQIIASMESQGRIFTLLLAVIGSISLLVGGIGVMNVMLVSVSERKKEIGIRKAVGAQNREIQTLFFIESIMLSLLGGSLGVIIGLILTAVVAFFSDWPFFITLTPPIAGFAVSVATGVFFGFYPARRAAQLEPIVSLRSE